MHPSHGLQHSTPAHVAQALSAAETSSQAIHNLYKSYKAIDARYSLPYICLKAKISSNGYLSDILHSKRRLPLKYADGIIRAFELKGPSASYLRLLIAIDHEKDESRAKKMRARVLPLRKALTVTHRDIGPDLPLFFLALEVFCAFGLFKNRPTRDCLCRYFTSKRPQEIDHAIDLLCSMKLVTKAGSHLALISEQIDFSGSNISQIEYLKMAFQHGATNVDRWFNERDSAVFESINISVKQSVLAEKLQELRQSLEDARFNLESEDADMLVRLNLQVYPLA